MTKDFLKDVYLEVCQKAFESGKLDRIRQNTGVYTFEMIRALKDMADADVYPDGRFGDEECNLWSLFHR